MWVMVSGPYSSGASTSQERAEHLRVLNRAALEVLRRGHVPVIGVNMALPMIWTGEDAAYDRIMMPLSLALAERCDACLRVGGPSRGADEEVEFFRSRGKPIYFAAGEIPGP